MSGTNPFRRKQTANPDIPTPRDAHTAPGNDSQTQLDNIDTGVPRSTKGKIGKTVRIVSPHPTSSEFGSQTSIYASFSPSIRGPSPPPETVSPLTYEGGDVEDPFGPLSDEGSAGASDDGTRQNTLSSAGGSVNTAETNGVPANPFKKTLANSEMQHGLDGRSAQTTNAKVEKRQLDVNDFKRLLLTGERPSSTHEKSGPPFAAHQSQPVLIKANSVIDPLSVPSRVSFEAPTGILHTTSQPSPEVLDPSDGGHASGHDTQRTTEKVKPSTPQHRHGKLVRTTAPREVSFEDPALPPLIEGRGSATLPPRTTATSTGLFGDSQNALPVLPDNLSTGNHQSPSDMNQRASDTSSKKAPPAAPPSRRGQPKTPFADSGRSLPISEESEATPRSHSKPTPPPPRRSLTMRQDSSYSVTAVASTTAFSGDSSSSTSKVPPPTPPTHSPSITAAKRPLQISPSSPAPVMPPPPPPPRRRGSSQSSYTPSRLSGDYRSIIGQRSRGDSGASSISQLQITPADTAVDRKDVLSDLSALQREVDELRGKMAR